MPKIDPAEKMARQGAITRARANQANLRAEFEERKRLEWAEVSAVANSDVNRAVWAARDAGLSVAAIGEAYGTKDRKTIYTILNSRDTAPQNVIENNAPEMVAVENAFEVAPHTNGLFKITLPDGQHAIVDPDPALDRTRLSQAFVKTSGLTPEIRALLDNTHPVWATLAAEAQTN